MILVPESRLLERLLASIFQARIVLAAIVSLAPCTENYYPLMHDPAVWWRNGGGII
jgi:hypothetical protein